MIELHEYYYKSGSYFTRNITVNIAEISCFYSDETNRYIAATTVEMKNGMKHQVRETYNEITELVKKATESDD